MDFDIYDALYDRIGKTYDMSRKSDPEIAVRLIAHLKAKIGKSYLDIGCGSGNYTEAIYARGFNISGLDISRQMLDLATQKKPQIPWIHGDARKLPFQPATFDGAICVLSTHHFKKELKEAFSEVFRVLKSGSFVIFTPLREHMKKWWLCEYFPNLMQKAGNDMESFDRLSQNLREAGFLNIRKEKFFVTPSIEDKFLYSGKHNPEIYLDPVVRSGIYLFNLKEFEDEVALGCENLRSDIESGRIAKVLASYANDLEDYVFVTADKLKR